MDNLPPEPIPTFPSSPQPGSKLIPVLLTLFILVLLGLIGLLYYQNQQLTKLLSQKKNSISVPTTLPSPTPDPTGDWQIYKDEEMGIEFKYPEQLLVEKLSYEEYTDDQKSQQKEGLLPDLGLKVWLDKDKPELSKNTETIHFNPAVYFSIIRMRNTKSSFSDWLKQQEGISGMPETISLEEQLKLKEFELSGNKVYFYNGLGIGQGTFNYVFIKNSSEYIVFQSLEPQKTIENDPLMKKILSSLRFTQ